MTNANVVAGADRTLVHTRGGIVRAVPVVFDPDLDIAVLRVRAAPVWLAMDTTPAGPGARGGVLGYPAGGPLHR